MSIVDPKFDARQDGLDRLDIVSVSLGNLDGSLAIQVWARKGQPSRSLEFIAEDVYGPCHQFSIILEIAWTRGWGGW